MGTNRGGLRYDCAGCIRGSSRVFVLGRGAGATASRPAHSGRSDRHPTHSVENEAAASAAGSHASHPSSNPARDGTRRCKRARVCESWVSIHSGWVPKEHTRIRSGVKRGSRRRCKGAPLTETGNAKCSRLSGSRCAIAGFAPSHTEIAKAVGLEHSSAVEVAPESAREEGLDRRSMGSREAFACSAKACPSSTPSTCPE